MSVSCFSPRLAAAAIALVTGCTTWSTATVYGPKQEVERHLLGSPAIEESSSSSLSGGFSHDSSTDSQHYRGGHWRDSSSVGTFGGDTSSTRLTHCVQQAEIHYSQPYEVVPVKSGRLLDVAGSVGLIMLGGMIMMVAEVRSQTIFQPGDPLYQEPPSATPGLLIGGAAMAGGIGLLAYSFGSLPKSPPPKVEQGRRDLVETDFVEATGCGLPGDPAAQR